MNVISVFDGMSCGMLALDAAGIVVDKYFASEIDRYALIVSQKNYPDIIQIGDIQKVRIRGGWIITEKKAHKAGAVDLFIGGSPCQGFSFAGKQLNFKDPRSKLFFEYIRILNEIKKENPDVLFLLENVRMKKEYQDIISDFLGCQPVAINSGLVSAQNRYRLYWTNIPNISQPEDRGLFMRDILEENVNEKYLMSDIRIRGLMRRKESAKDRGAGFGYNIQNIDGKSNTLLARYGKDGKECIVECGRVVGRKLVDGVRADYNKDVPTIQRWEPNATAKTNCLTTVQKDNVLNVDGTYRILTPVECERLQTVPDGYTSSVSDSQRYKMLGNGWTVEVIAHILKNIPK